MTKFAIFRVHNDGKKFFITTRATEELAMLFIDALRQRHPSRIYTYDEVPDA